jgi:hypothetical protein
LLEGVECLIVAEFLQKWAYQQDVDKNDFVSFNLEKIYDNAILRFSNIRPNDWNKYTSKLEYKKITTFGKIIFSNKMIPSLNFSFFLTFFSNLFKINSEEI